MAGLLKSLVTRDSGCVGDGVVVNENVPDMVPLAGVVIHGEGGDVIGDDNLPSEALLESNTRDTGTLESFKAGGDGDVSSLRSRSSRSMFRSLSPSSPRRLKSICFRSFNIFNQVINS